MNKNDLENLIDLKKYKEYRESHTQKDTMKFFDVSRRNVLYLDELLGLDKEYLNSIASKARGEGYSKYWNNLSEEEKQIKNKENSERIKQAYINNPNYAKEHSELMKEYYSDESNRNKHSFIMKEYFDSHHEAKEKDSLGVKKYYEDPKNREKLSNSIKEYYKDPLARELNSKRLKEYYNNPENVEKNRQAQLKYWSSDEGEFTKQVLREKAIYKWTNDSEYVAKITAGLKESKPVKEFRELLTSLNINHSTETYIPRYRYDIDIKDSNIFIEINPTATHNISWSPFGDHTGVDKDYHYNKSITALENGYRCIHIWDWDDIEKIVKMLVPREKVYARKCEIRLVKPKEAKEFIDEYHLQGSTRSDGSKNTIRIGLYYNDELVSIMTFGKPRYNKNYEYELLRFCSSYAVIGGAEKLFKYFLRNYNPTSIISYCDFSKFTGKTYEKLGFKKDGLSLGKHWYSSNLNIHITDNLLRQQGFDRLLGDVYGTFGKGTSNEELMLNHRFLDVVDAGQIKYVYKNE